MTSPLTSPWEDTMPATSTRAFVVDEDYDVNHASDRHSRYGSYLYSRSHLFHEDGEPITDAGEFAAVAFTIACAPVMSPGYVREHPRVRHVSRCWDDDHRLAFEVQVVAPLPAPIAEAIRSKGWADWQRQWGSEWWFEPYDNNRPGAYTVVTVRVPLAPDSLPMPAYTAGAPDLDAARTAVRAVCGQLNTHLTPILAALTTT